MNETSEVVASCKICGRKFSYYDNECTCYPLCPYKLNCWSCNNKTEIELKKIDDWVNNFIESLKKHER